MLWQDLCTALFGAEHAVQADGDFICGEARLDGRPITVFGSTNHAAVGVELALRQARVVLDTVAAHPGRPLLLLVDTQGQALRRRDELLGIHRAMAHLGSCVELARRQGHPVLGLVYDQALSGGFITSGLIADACDALPEAEIRVMRIPAMARVTKIAEDRLQALSADNPVFAPGVGNYVAMGGVRRLWDAQAPGGLAQALRDALADLPLQDERARLGAERGGRRLAASVIDRVLAAP